MAPACQLFKSLRIVKTAKDYQKWLKFQGAGGRPAPWNGDIQIKEGLAAAPDATLAAAAFFHFEKGDIIAHEYGFKPHLYKTVQLKDLNAFP